MILHPDEDGPVPIVLYLAGPISAPGLPDDEVAWAELQVRAQYASEVEGILHRMGYVVINPFSSCLSRRNWDSAHPSWVNSGCWKLTLADGIVLLPGWQDSKGVTQELQFAQAHGLSVDVWQPATENLIPLGE
jgi:hypothetical protein